MALIGIYDDNDLVNARVPRKALQQSRQLIEQYSLRASDLGFTPLEVDRRPYTDEVATYGVRHSDRAIAEREFLTVAYRSCLRPIFRNAWLPRVKVVRVPKGAKLEPFSNETFYIFEFGGPLNLGVSITTLFQNPHLFRHQSIDEIGFGESSRKSARRPFCRLRALGIRSPKRPVICGKVHFPALQYK